MIRKHPVGAFTLRKDSTVPGPMIGRDQILAKYWELANLEPEKTKGSVTGQLAALDALRSLCEKLRQKPVDANRPATQEIYRAAWMAPRTPRTN